MATAIAKRRGRSPKTATPSPATPKDQQPEPKSVAGVDSTELVEQLDQWVNDSETHYNGNDYKLKETTKENEALYYGWNVSKNDDEDENASLDNRIFSSIRTIVPFVTSRVTEPEVYPSSNSVEAKRFAEDFAKALHAKMTQEKLKPKLKFGLEDAIVRRRGYLKPRYDAATGNFCAIEYVPCESIVIDHKAKPYEEPRYFRHCLERSVDDLLTMFPEMADKIKQLFAIDKNTPRSKYLEQHTINEDWSFVTIEGKLDLVVCWNYKKTPLAVVKDPNWRYGDSNFLDSHMMPLVSINVLNDGRSFIDRTSYVEQAKYSQGTINKRGEQIGENAGLGSVGMPVVDGEALADDQAQYLQYEEDTVLILKVPEGKRLQDVFDKWQASPLSPDVYKDKLDAIEAVNNAFGASSINQGQESDNNTLGQDVLLRDQSNGRQQDIVDAIDNAMDRLYKLVAQFMLVYGTEKELFKFVGENSTFDYLIMNSNELDTNAEIRVKSGTSMPLDNAQRRATADKAAGQAMIDPLTYWEIMDEPNAQKYAKRVAEYTANPQMFLSDASEEVFNRDAYVDIQLVKVGKPVPYRDDLPKEYFDYLNQYVLSGDLDNPKIPLSAKQAVTSFIDTQLARGQKMLGMLETQLPTPGDVQMHNQQVDQANQANADAAKGIPKPPPTGTMKPAIKPQGALV
jgi:hypothetical protein